MRDELIVEFNHDQIDEHEKRRLQERIASIDEKVQALGKFV